MSKKKNKQLLIKWLDQFIDNYLRTQTQTVSERVEKLRLANPGLSNLQLAQKIRNDKATKNGLVGAATSFGGLITLPVTVPAYLIATWQMQISLTVLIAYIFGYTKESTDLKTDIYLILAGSSAQEVLESVGVDSISKITKNAIKEYITRDVVSRLLQIIPQKIIAKSGQKSLKNVMKLAPVVGASIGFVFDYAATRAVGNFAIKYYADEN